MLKIKFTSIRNNDNWNQDSDRMSTRAVGAEITNKICGDRCERLELWSLGRMILGALPLVAKMEPLSSNVLTPVTARTFTEVVEGFINKTGDRSRNFLLEVLDVKWVWMINVRNFVAF